MIILNKTIAFTKSWKQTLWIAVSLSVVLPLLLITLEPFDNSNDFSYKYIILSGYALCIFIPILLVNPLENYIYKKQNNRWFVLNEIFYILLAFFLIMVCCFLYHFYIVSGLTVFSFSEIWDFTKSFGLPFTPILIPLWLYLRSKYGIIQVPLKDEVKTNTTKKVTIHGDNKSEAVTILEIDFMYAQAQQNYVELFFNTENGVEQKLLRSTLSNIMKQLPNAWQVHRSYLVNLDYLKSVEGNARKRYIKILNTEEIIPVSQKYYAALSKRVSNSSQDLQD